MKFSEIKTKLESGIGWSDLGLEVKDYIPIGQKYGAASVILNPENGVIENINGFTTINRFNYDVSLYALLCKLYINLEYDGEFTDEMLDVFLKYKFQKWLGSVTKQDSFDFENILKTTTIDEVRRLNANIAFDVEGIKGIVDKLNNLDPDVIEALKGLNPTTLNATREMVDNVHDN
jgi:hypothetical protein